MEIHNLMEKMVIDVVDDIFSDKVFIERTGCNNSDACRTDVVCYVLNRIQPIYTTSSRGLAHLGKTFIDEPQSIADITALVNEGIRQVGTHLRPVASETTSNLPEPPIFNFPIIKGKVVDGKTFAPYSGSSISLKMNGELVKMNGLRWNNPCELIAETDGNFLFWPLPIKAEKIGEQKSFSFELSLSASGYKPVKHFLDFELKADDKFINSMEVDRIFKVESIYLFNIDDPEEIIPD